MSDVYENYGDDTLLGSRSKRQRTKINRFDFETLANEEQAILQRALINSRKEVKRVTYTIPEGPTYYPTVEEFADPILYMTKITQEAEKYGICKIVPPSGWNPPCLVNMENPLKMPTKLQTINTLQEGNGFPDGNSYTIAEYKEMANNFYRQWSEKYYNGIETIPLESLAKDYWDMVETSNRTVEVEYANDLDTKKYGSGFPRATKDVTQESKEVLYPSSCEEGESSPFKQVGYYNNTGWNVRNIALNKNGVLKNLAVPINGINVPWLYVGMLFASFCWHNEDNYLYSINYSHFGAPKQWYGVAGSEAKKFEDIAKKLLLISFQDRPDLLHHMTLQLGPSILSANGLPIYKITQEFGIFIIIFPKAYHGGFSYGFNCNEAVNFATAQWINYGADARERYRLYARPTALNYDRLMFTLFNNCRDVPEYALKDLADRLREVMNEDLLSRNELIKSGIRCLPDDKCLPRNNFALIDNDMDAYDEKRECNICKHICLFSAVICQCSNSKVACCRHARFLCKCPSRNKLLLIWATNEELRRCLAQLNGLSGVKYASPIKLDEGSRSPVAAPTNHSPAKYEVDLV